MKLWARTREPEVDARRTRFMDHWSLAQDDPAALKWPHYKKWPLYGNGRNVKTTVIWENIGKWPKYENDRNTENGLYTENGRYMKVFVIWKWQFYGKTYENDLNMKMAVIRKMVVIWKWPQNENDRKMIKHMKMDWNQTHRTMFVRKFKKLVRSQSSYLWCLVIRFRVTIWIRTRWWIDFSGLYWNYLADNLSLGGAITKLVHVFP